MYAVMLETEFVKKDKFNENFFSDWKKILGKNHVIQDLSKCDFGPIHEWHLQEKEKKKQMTTDVSIHYRIVYQKIIISLRSSEDADFIYHLLSVDLFSIRLLSIYNDYSYMQLHPLRNDSWFGGGESKNLWVKE